MFLKRLGLSSELNNEHTDSNVTMNSLNSNEENASHMNIPYANISG